MRTKYEEEFWDKQAELENLEDLLTEKATVAKLIKILTKGIKADRIVELGSAIGRLTVPIAKKFPKSEVFGVDISAKMIKRAKKAKNIKYIKTDGKTINLDNIDYVYSITLFQHLEEDELKNYLQEVYNCLNTGGSFIFQFVEGEERTELSQQYSESEITDWVRAVGFKVVDVKQAIYPNWKFVTLIK